MFVCVNLHTNAYNSRTRYCREFRFAAFCSPNSCGVRVIFRFWKMRARAGRRLKNCFYNTLSNSRTVWDRKFNFASFCNMKYPKSKKPYRFDVLCACAGWRPIIYFGYHKIPTPITQEPDIVESSGLWHSVALIDAEFKFFSDFWKCARRRAEGQKTVFTIPSLTREQFEIESSTLRHFVTWSILNLRNHIDLV